MWAGWWNEESSAESAAGNQAFRRGRTCCPEGIRGRPAEMSGASCACPTMHGESLNLKEAPVPRIQGSLPVSNWWPVAPRKRDPGTSCPLTGGTTSSMVRGEGTPLLANEPDLCGRFRSSNVPAGRRPARRIQGPKARVGCPRLADSGRSPIVPLDEGLGEDSHGVGKPGRARPDQGGWRAHRRAVPTKSTAPARRRSFELSSATRLSDDPALGMSKADSRDRGPFGMSELRCFHVAAGLPACSRSWCRPRGQPPPARTSGGAIS